MSTPSNPMVIAALLFFDEPLDWEKLTRLVRTNLLSHRRFRQHVEDPPNPLAPPRWCDDSPFELGLHLVKTSHPIEAAALPYFLSRQLSEPLVPDRSPWRFDVAELASGGCALFARIHHCIADGMALVGVLGELAGFSAERPSAPRTPAAPKRPAIAPGMDASLHIAKAARTWLSLPSRSDTELDRAPAGWKQLAWSDPIGLEGVSALAKARSRRVTDVLLASVAGAVGRCLGPRSPANLRCLFPVADKSATPGELGNHYASVFIDLPVGLADPLLRLDEVARRTAAMQQSDAATTALDLTGIVGVLPAALEHLLLRWFSHKAKFIVSTLAGPREPIAIAGQPLRSVVVFAPALGLIGSTFTFFGYAGNLRLGVETDAAVVPDPRQLVDAFMMELAHLMRFSSETRARA